MLTRTSFFTVAFALTLAAAGGASASSLTVLDLGSVDPSAPAFVLGNGITVTAVNNAPVVSGGGQNSGVILGSNGSNQFGNSQTYTDGSVGWDPFGNGISTNRWLSIGGSSGNSLIAGVSNSSITLSFTQSPTSLQFVWGSSSGTNTVSLYNQSALIGTVTADGSSNLYIDGSTTAAISNANLDNNSGPGALIRINSSQVITSAVLSTSSGVGGFEVGNITAVPIPGALLLFGSGLTALAGVGAARRRTAAA